MSLKGFHIVFVTISTLLFAFLTVWAFVLAPEPSALSTTLGILGAAGVLVMPAYGIYFYRKAVHIHL